MQFALFQIESKLNYRKLHKSKNALCAKFCDTAIVYSSSIQFEIDVGKKYWVHIDQNKEYF